MRRFLLAALPLLFLLALAGLLPRLSRAEGNAEPMAESSPFETLGHIGGLARAVAVQGNYAYVGLGSEVAVLDIADAAHPTQLGTLELAGPVRKIGIAGSYAYVLSGDGTLSIIDVASPESPIKRGHYTAPGPISDLALQGNHVYLAGTGLRLIDISDPAAPKEIAWFHKETDRYITDVEVAGSYAYLLHIERAFVYPEIEGRLQIVDVSNPLNPVGVGSFTPATPFHQQVHRLAVAEERVYIIYSFADSGHTRYFLDVVDVSTPSAPTRLTSLDLNWNNTYSTLAISGGYAYLGTAGSITIIDLEATGGPRRFFLAMPSWSYELAFSGERAYVANGAGGLRVLHLESPTEPKVIGVFETVASATDVVAANGHAYVVDQGERGEWDRAIGNGLKVIAPNYPQHPIAGVHPANGIGSITLEGTFLYLPEGNCSNFKYLFCWGGLRILALTPPTTTTHIGWYGIEYLEDERDFPKAVAVSDTLAYLATPSQGLHVLDLSNPITPTKVGQYTGTLNVALDVQLLGQYAYVAGGSAGLQVLDVSTPTSPTLAAAMTDFSVQVVEIAGTRGYLGSANALRVLDLSTPPQPLQIGVHYVQAGGINAITLSGRYAYLALGEGGLEIVDLSDPTRPLGVARYDSPGQAMGVAVDGAQIYLADGEGGLRWLRYGSTLAGRVADVHGTAVANTRLAVSGMVERRSEQGMTSVPFSETVRADAGGQYALHTLSPGSYIVTPTLPGYSFWPPTRTVTLPADDQKSQDFTLLPAPVSALLEPNQATTLTLTDTQGLLTRLTIPAGAVSEPLTLQLRPISVPAPPGSAWGRHAFDLKLYRGGEPLSSFAFAAPVTVAIQYSEADLTLVADEEALALRRWNESVWQEAAQTCQPAASYQHDVANNTLSLPVCQAGRFALFGPTNTLFLPLASQ